MDKKELILTVAKDIFVARVGKDTNIKSFADAVKIVSDALKSIAD